MSYILLKTQSGTVKHMKDHTQWFQENYGNTLPYHDAVFEAAIKPDGRGARSLENIKELARYGDDGRCIEILVRDGVRL